MSDASSTTTTTTPPPAPLPNTAEARTPDGTLKDVQTPASTETKPTTTPETKPSTETKPEVKAEPGKAPDKYADFKAPEGVTLNKDAIDAAVPIFKELGLSQDQAQKLVELQAKREVDAAKAPQDAYTAMRNGWKSEVLANSELSTGGKLKPEVSETIGRAIASMGDTKVQDAFRQGMDLYGWGDNPAVVQGLYALGKLVTEGRPVQAGGPASTGQQQPGTTTKPTAAKALFPNLA